LAESASHSRQPFWPILRRWRAWLIPPALLVLALLPRLSAFWQGFVTSDELLWLYNSARFGQALETGRPTDIPQTARPGVTTMWVGTLSLLNAHRQNPTATAAHLTWIAPVSRFAAENTELAIQLVPFLPTARLIVAAFNALGVVGIYFLARRLGGEKAALAGALLIALDPFTVAFSGLLHVDALMVPLLILCLLVWFNALQCSAERTNGRRLAPAGLTLALLSGLCAGLAILSRTTAISIIPVMLISTALWPMPKENRSLKTILLHGFLWLVGLLVALFGAFPAMWGNPARTWTNLYTSIAAYRQLVSTAAVDHGGFPGRFYMSAYLLRLTPLTLIGLALSVGAPLFDRGRGAPQRRFVYVLLWLFVGSVTLLSLFHPVRADLYLLPAFPALNLLAGIGWSEAIDWPFKLRGRSTAQAGQAIMLLVLGAAQGAALFGGYPYYLDTYNPLVGGIEAAMHTLPVGRGEGLEQVAAYLNRLPQAETTLVAVTNPLGLAPLFQGRTLFLDDRSGLLADYLVITAQDRQVDAARVDALVGGAEVVYTVRAGGVPIVWLYRTAYTAEAAYLAQFAAPTDLILCDAPIPFARHTPVDALPKVQIVDQADENEMVAMLNRWRALHTRLWYLASPAASPITAQAIRRQLDSYAVRLDVVDLGYVTLTLYILPGDADFRPLENMPLPLGAVGLTGIALTRADPPADGSLDMVLRWRAETRPAADMFPFVHLRDQAGHLWAVIGGDRLLLDRRGYPTSAWQPGEGVEQSWGLPLPPGLPPGRYRVYVGLTDTQGRTDDHAAPALEVEIGPAQKPPLPDELAFAHSPSVTWRGRLRLFGVDLPTRAVAGQTVVVGIGWTALDRPDERYNIRLSLEGSDGRGGPAQTVALSRFPTDQWRRGETLRELYDLVLPADMSNGRYTLSIQVLDANGIALSPPVSLAAITVGAE